MKKKENFLLAFVLNHFENLFGFTLIEGEISKLKLLLLFTFIREVFGGGAPPIKKTHN